MYRFSFMHFMRLITAVNTYGRPSVSMGASCQRIKYGSETFYLFLRDYRFSKCLVACFRSTVFLFKHTARHFCLCISSSFKDSWKRNDCRKIAIHETVILLLYRTDPSSRGAWGSRQLLLEHSRRMSHCSTICITHHSDNYMQIEYICPTIPV